MATGLQLTASPRPSHRRLGYRLQREWRELRTAWPLITTRNWHRWRGRGEAAVRCQAELIRHAERQRESLSAYQRLHGLIRRYGDGGLDLCVSAEPPPRWLFFVGYSRSGHSLVGSLLDAHPEIAVAHEQHALKHLAAGRPYLEVARAMQYNAQIFQRLGRHYTGYDYQVPGQYQGSTRRPVIVGDKKGNGAARVLAREPDLIARLDRHLPGSYVFVHVIRNPFDNIVTKAMRTGRSLDGAAGAYFANAEVIRALKNRCHERVLDVYLDDLIARPEATLHGLLQRLGMSADEAYLRACASILFRTPRRTRDRVRWPEGLRGEIDRRLAGIPFLARFAGSADG